MESKNTQDDTETQFSGVILCFFVILLVSDLCLSKKYGLGILLHIVIVEVA